MDKTEHKEMVELPDLTVAELVHLVPGLEPAQAHQLIQALRA